jgi:hypothetical protein
MSANKVTNNIPVYYYLILFVLFVVVWLLRGTMDNNSSNNVSVVVETTIPNNNNNNQIELPIIYDDSTNKKSSPSGNEIITTALQQDLEGVSNMPRFIPVLVVWNNGIVRARHALEFFSRNKDDETMVYVIPHDLSMDNIDSLRKYSQMVKINLEIFARKGNDFDPLSAQLHGLAHVLNITSPMSCLLLINLASRIWDSKFTLDGYKFKNTFCLLNDHAFAYRPSSESLALTDTMTIGPIIAIPSNDLTSRGFIQEWVIKHEKCFSRSFYETLVPAPDGAACSYAASQFLLSKFPYRYSEEELWESEK